MRFDTSLLGLKLSRADAESRCVCEERCRELLDRLGNRADIVNRVRSVIYENPCARRDVVSVASKLCMSARTLRRHLQQAGTVIHCEAGKEVPYTKDILHETFKDKFLIRETINAIGKNGQSKVLTLHYSTTELTAKQFSEFIDNITRFCWQFWQYNIPPPVGMFDQWATELGIKQAA